MVLQNKIYSTFLPPIIICADVEWFCEPHVRKAERAGCPERKRGTSEAAHSSAAAHAGRRKRCGE